MASITLSTLNKLKERALSKKDGIYTGYGAHYVVKNSRLTHFTEFGKVMQCVNGFVVHIGNYKWGMGDLEGKKELKRFL